MQLQSQWNGMELLGLNLKYSSEMGAGKITIKQSLGTVRDIQNEKRRTLSCTSGVWHNLVMSPRLGLTKKAYARSLSLI